MKELAIQAYRCKKCGKVHYPFHDRCMACKGRDFEIIKPQGMAKLLTYTQIFNLPWGFDQRFLIIGVAEFEDGVKAMGQVNASSVDELKIGMAVEASWEPIRMQYGENVYGIKYTPV
jgi:scaffold protein (connect acetoacetyl-CoA thiolase and HMG-CoA synthase)